MNEDKRKHLEFIQNVITRMSSNSFYIKGWTVTFVTALFALAAKDANPKYVLISYFAIPILWILDGFYLSQERQYRSLYDVQRVAAATDYSMDASVQNTGRNTWVACVFSRTLLLLYLSIIGISLIVMWGMDSR
jgi:hypothetical protein